MNLRSPIRIAERSLPLRINRPISRPPKTRFRQSESFTPPPLEIIYEGDGYWAVNKPDFMLSGHWTRHDSLNYRLQQRFGPIQGKVFGTHRCYQGVHRLDYNTSGLIFAAKTVEALKQLRTLFQERRNEKWYLAIVHDDLSITDEDFYLVNVPVYRSRKGGFPYVLSPEEARERPGDEKWKRQEAATAFHVIERYEYKGRRYALVLVYLFTGRTHQIRYHLDKAGIPIFGEGKYTDQTYSTQDPLFRLCPHYALHAVTTTFIDPTRPPQLIYAGSPQEFAIQKKFFARPIGGFARLLKALRDPQKKPRDYWSPHALEALLMSLVVIILDPGIIPEIDLFPEQE